MCYWFFLLRVLYFLFVRKKFHARWWDYSDLPLNINGRVCLIFTICFGFAGIIVTQIIIPPIVQFIALIPVVVIELMALLFMFLFGMDMALTISALTTFAKEFERINEQINNQMAERVATLQSNLEDAKIARLEKAAIKRKQPL
ncbi:Predicted membrane protein [Butyrivibrio fibrisolvens 16/4]|nr:Predicted membrane protein [Butyrivibrio fibrisolvens 16/4]